MNRRGCSVIARNFGLILAAGAVASCSLLQKKDGTAKPAEHSKYFAVSAEETPFYRYGPQQGYGPDSKLPRGTLMTQIRPSFGYCKVQLENGQVGYVASEDVKPASPQDVAASISAAALAAAPSAPSRPPPRGLFHVNPSDPRLEVPPEPLPESKPEFRY